MKINIIIGLLLFFFLFGSCHKSEISIEGNTESSIVLKAAPPQVGYLHNKQSYYQYSYDLFNDLRNLIHYTDSLGSYPHFLTWDENMWKSAYSHYLVAFHLSDYNNRWNLFIENFTQWNQGTYIVNQTPLQIQLMDEIEAEFEAMGHENFYSEALAYLDEKFDSVYVMEGITFEEKDLLLSSIMLIRGNIIFTFESIDHIRVPIDWRKVAKCSASMVGGSIAGGLSGVGGAVGLLKLGLIVLSGPAVPFDILTGAVGGVLIGSVHGGCFD